MLERMGRRGTTLIASRAASSVAGGSEANRGEGSRSEPGPVPGGRGAWRFTVEELQERCPDGAGGLREW